MHGELGRALCQDCSASRIWLDDIAEHSQCLACGARGRLRPDVVWFGEMPYRMEETSEALGGCELFAAIGTSAASIRPPASRKRHAPPAP